MSMLSLEIITPERLVLQEEVDMVEARGEMGEFGILPGHIKFLTTIDIGEIRYFKGDKRKHIATSGGFAEVVEDKVTVLVETAELAEEIDIERAKRAKDRAESALRDLAADADEYRLHELALLRAITRISAASQRA